MAYPVFATAYHECSSRQSFCAVVSGSGVWANWGEIRRHSAIVSRILALNMNVNKLCLYVVESCESWLPTVQLPRCFIYVNNKGTASSSQNRRFSGFECSPVGGPVVENSWRSHINRLQVRGHGPTLAMPDIETRNYYPF